MTNARGSSHVVVILRVNRELWRGRLISFLFPASPSDLNSIFYYVTGRLYTGKEEWDYHGYCGWSNTKGGRKGKPSLEDSRRKSDDAPRGKKGDATRVVLCGEC